MLQRRKQPSVVGKVFYSAAACAASSSSLCCALSLPRTSPLPFLNTAGRGSNDLGGGGKIPPPWDNLNFGYGDGDDRDDDLYIFHTAHLWILSSSDEVASVTKEDESTEDVHLLKTRGGDGAVKRKSPNSNKRITDSLNDALDSLHNTMMWPFRVLGQRLPSSLLSKMKVDRSLLKDQEKVLRSTKVQSVTAPESDLLPPDVITQSATDAKLIGGTLNPEALELTATAINRWYAENGYVLNSITGATLIPSASTDDGERSNEGRVELKVKEVKLAKTSQNSSFPVKLRLVERVDNDYEEASDRHTSLITLPLKSAEMSQSKEEHQTFKSVSGCTRPKKIASLVNLVPGSHFRLIPDRWSKLVALPGGVFGAGGGKSAIFSHIHAVRPIPEESSRGDSVSIEVIASENKPYAALEYGLTKSLYSDKWEGELDLKHANAFGGGEVASFNMKKGRSKGRQRLNDGSLSWKMSVKDSFAGYDFNLFGVGGKTRKKQQIEAMEKARIDNVANEEAGVDVVSDETEGNPMHFGATMRVRLPPSIKRKLKASVVSATFERISTQTIASASVGVGPCRFNPFYSLQSLFSASITSGVRSNTHQSSDAGVVPYAAFTCASQHTVPLGSSPVSFAVRNVASGGTEYLPRHEAVSLGISSKVRGYSYNYQHQTTETSSVEEEQEKGTLQALKKFWRGCRGAHTIRPSIATSKALSGTMELRVPFQAASDALQPILSGTFLLFGDWSLTQAHPSSSTIEKETLRCSSAGVGLRKVVQGVPIKVDACITEHGSRGIFFGIGGHEFI